MRISIYLPNQESQDLGGVLINDGYIDLVGVVYVPGAA